MNPILVDTSILIQVWRKPDSEPEILRSNLSHINTISYIEFLQGANRRQKSDAVEFLRSYLHVRLDEATSDLAITLIDKHSETDGLRLADALIAATCIVHDLSLLTLNRRHFENIGDLSLI
ncbi:MAG: PIN domain-containing protein [Pyrinomonadaceae bacterium]